MAPGVGMPERKPATMKNNTIVTASDLNYAWGVWLLAASIRKAGMDEPILVGTFNWSDAWLEDIRKIPGLATVPLPIEDRRSVTCSKPEIMLRAETDFATWVDCDGIFSGNCSDRLVGGEREMNIRLRTPSEVAALYRKERFPGDDPEEVPSNILDVWRRDVGEREEPRRRCGCSAALIGVHRSARPFLEHWRNQMRKVLPADVGVVDAGNFAYFQTDEAVLNSLMIFAFDVPEVVREYRADRLPEPHFIHFGYNPKPWSMWTSGALRDYETTLELIDWAAAQGYAPRAALPYTFRRRHEALCRRLAPLAPQVHRARRLKQRLLGKFRFR